MARGQSKQIVIGMAAAGFIAGAMVVGAFAPGHGPGPAAAEEPSYLRVVHASPDSPPIDVSVDGAAGLSTAAFGAVGSYLEHPAGTAVLTISRPGDGGATLLEREVELGPRTVKTVAVTGAGTDGIGLHVFDDAPVTPAGNDAALRVVHLSPGAPPVAVTTANGRVMADRVDFGNASEYVTVPAGTYSLEVRMVTADGDEAVVETATISVAGGTASSVLVVRDAGSDGSVTVVHVEDASMSLQLPAETTAESADPGH